MTSLHGGRGSGERWLTQSKRKNKFLDRADDVLGQRSKKNKNKDDITRQLSPLHRLYRLCVLSWCWVCKSKLADVICLRVAADSLSLAAGLVYLHWSPGERQARWENSSFRAARWRTWQDKGELKEKEKSKEERQWPRFLRECYIQVHALNDVQEGH